MFDRLKARRATEHAAERGRSFAASAAWPFGDPRAPASNPLRDYFEANREGPGIWKWTHYFDAYHRHLQEFRGRSPRLLEIGIYSGGSLGMWREYLGEGSHIIGMDIEPACTSYARPGVEVIIGDQKDREFWGRFRSTQAPVDIVIDDGGHLPEQQIVTLEETLPHLAAGGVFICEDVHGQGNPFTTYVRSLTDELYQFAPQFETENVERVISSPATGIQSLIESVTFYPYMVVVKKRPEPVHEFLAAKRGTEWQPFLY